MSQNKVHITPDKFPQRYEYIQSNIRRRLQGLPSGRRYIRSHWPIFAILKGQGTSKKLRTMTIHLFGVIVQIQFALDVDSVASILGDE